MGAPFFAAEAVRRFAATRSLRISTPRHVVSHAKNPAQKATNQFPLMLNSASAINFFNCSSVSTCPMRSFGAFKPSRLYAFAIVLDYGRRGRGSNGGTEAP
jgi:hypothetical protein